VERDREAGHAGLAENVDASLDAVEEILTALLDISRLDTGAMKPQWSSFRIEEIFRQLQREFGPVAARSPAAHLRGLLAHRALGPAPAAPARAEPRLERGQVHAQRAGARGRAPARGPGRGRGLGHGLGIPVSKQKVVFREFQRLDQGAKVARGLGLGLSIVERIGRVLDHPVTLKSEAGRGSVFRVAVPVAALPATVAPLEAPRGPLAPLAGLRVLAIDNEPAIQEGMRTLLTGWGCAVATAADLPGALAALDAAVPRRSSPITTSTTATASMPSRPYARPRAGRSPPSSSRPTARSRCATPPPPWRCTCSASP
jgi:CheY-like chemotaxis protein